MDGSWKEELKGIKDFISKQFRLHFKKNSRARVYLYFNFPIQKLVAQDGEFLTRHFSEEGVKQAIFECECSKSPGPDGFNMSFFKTCWHIIKPNLMRVMEEFFDHGKVVKGGNDSFIVLIPKKDGANEINHFRPISLIGSLNKIAQRL